MRRQGGEPSGPSSRMRLRRGESEGRARATSTSKRRPRHEQHRDGMEGEGLTRASTGQAERRGSGHQAPVTPLTGRPAGSQGAAREKRPRLTGGTGARARHPQAPGRFKAIISRVSGIIAQEEGGAYFLFHFGARGETSLIDQIADRRGAFSRTVGPACEGGPVCERGGPSVRASEGQKGGPKQGRGRDEAEGGDEAEGEGRSRGKRGRSRGNGGQSR